MDNCNWDDDRMDRDLEWWYRKISKTHQVAASIKTDMDSMWNTLDRMEEGLSDIRAGIARLRQLADDSQPDLFKDED